MQIGDIVRLKSGGPSMTVVRIMDGTGDSNKGDVLCCWFYNGDLKSFEFPKTLLDVGSTHRSPSWV